jgi:DNA mismatch repair protein MutS
MPKVKQKNTAAGVKQTPMLRQYLEQKEQYPDCILFFRLGDFYEMFFEDAERAAEVLDIALTSRSKGEEAYPMCGVPYFSANTYIAKLIERGHKVAVCDQVEDARQAKGIVKRAVTRVVSPGMITDPEDLDFREANYLAGLVDEGEDALGLAFLDVSTADFRLTQVADAQALIDELARIQPRELLLPTALADSALCSALAERFPDLFIKVTGLDSDKERAGLELFERQLPAADRERLADAQRRVGLEAARLVFAYAAASLPGSLGHVRRIADYQQAEHLVIDANSRSNLELTRNLMEGQRRGSLLGLIDRCRSPMGSRLMSNWLLFPLLSVERIRRRADAVEQLVDDAVLRGDLRDCLAGVRDIERLLAKTTVGRATPRDLGALRDSLRRLPDWAALIRARGGQTPLALLLGELDLLDDLLAELDASLVEEPPADTSAGGAIRQGRDARLDELVGLATSGRDYVARLEQRERERTTIASLKVKYNKVFGYFIEVTKPNLHLVPDDYRRKQTTANAERYETEELKRLEDQILTAQEDRVALELDLIAELVERVRAAGERLLTAARQLATSDVVAALADLAAEQGYCRPEVDDGEAIAIEEGRHPVVERLMKDEPFVPNDLQVDCEQQQVLIITGPNMAGKSTAIRQVALIAVLAQMGAFVPARRASIGLVDRIFTRIGAADNLARGQSTFMVEMVETAHILNHATRRSLLVLDEIGRGTSTFDGLSIAWAVAEFIHQRVGARCLFATHYHQLADLALTRPRVANYTISVKEWRDQIIFLRRLVPGITSRSYGIQVGKLAGLPQEVIERAEEVLANLEGQEFDEIGAPRLSRSEGESGGAAQLQLFAAARSPLEDELRQLDLDGLTPMEALNTLHRWKEDLR